jgi:serine/threonine protein phosphatase PrpC
MRHVLTSVIGAREELPVNLTERTLSDGELLLLCSDGLHGELTPQAMSEILAKGTEAAPLAEGLVQAVLEGRAGDNVTALVVKYRS